MPFQPPLMRTLRNWRLSRTLSLPPACLQFFRIHAWLIPVGQVLRCISRPGCSQGLNMKPARRGQKSAPRTNRPSHIFDGFTSLTAGDPRIRSFRPVRSRHIDNAATSFSSLNGNTDIGRSKGIGARAGRRLACRQPRNKVSAQPIMARARRSGLKEVFPRPQTSDHGFEPDRLAGHLNG